MVNPEHWEWPDEQGPRGNVREAVALFDSEDDMQAAVDELETKGFSNTAMSRPAAPATVETALHHKIHTAKDLEDDSHVPREAVIGPHSHMEGNALLVAIPVYLLVMVAAGFAASQGAGMSQTIGLVLMVGLLGGVIGGGIVYRMSMRKARQLQRQRKWGGFLLWVRTGNRSQEDKAITILRDHAGRDVHMHGPVH